MSLKTITSTQKLIHMTNSKSSGLKTHGGHSFTPLMNHIRCINFWHYYDV